MICVEDFDLWLKVARLTEKFFYLPKSLGAYWMDTGNVSEASEKIFERLKFVYEKHLPSLNNRDKQQSETIMSYLLGRTKQKLGIFDQASIFFKVALRSKNLKIKFYSLCWLILINLVRHPSKAKVEKK